MLLLYGRLAEWFNATVLKTVIVKAIASSNLAPSARGLGKRTL